MKIALLENRLSGQKPTDKWSIIKKEILLEYSLSQPNDLALLYAVDATSHIPTKKTKSKTEIKSLKKYVFPDICSLSKRKYFFIH